MGFTEILTSAPVLTTAGVTAASAAGVYLYAAKVEARNFQLERVSVTKCGATQNGNGGSSSQSRKLNILHLSDLHLCAPETKKIDFLQALPTHEFDLVVVTGDIFENESGIEYAKYICPKPPKYGAYAVFGNHDYFAYTWFNKTMGRLNRKYRHPKQKRDVQPFVDALAEGGITALRHDAVHLKEPNAYLIGLDYPGTTEQHVKQLASGAPDGALVLAAIHVPRKLNHLVNAGVHLAFAGHTHGGQIRVPGVGALITDSELPRHEASGVVRRGDTLIHVSRGLSADPKTNFRLFCPPAATVVEISY